MIKFFKIFCYKKNLFWLRDLKKEKIKKHLYAAKQFRKNNAWRKHNSYAIKKDKLSKLIETRFPSFINFATAHYIYQLKYIGQYENDLSHISLKFYEDRLSLAVNYLERNRNRLFEWFVVYSGFCNNFFNDEDWINYDLYGFDHALENKIKNELNVEINIDKHHNNGCGICVINKDGSLNEHFLYGMMLCKTMNFSL